MLSASPIASAAVVEAVGARPSGHASMRIDTSRWTSAACASGERGLPVIATIGTPSRFSHGRSARISSVSPLFERATTTSPFTIRPRSPWMASAGCRKNDDWPVEARVAEIFWAMIPLLPMPVATTRPEQARRIVDRAVEALVEPRHERADRLGLDLQHLAGGLSRHQWPNPNRS